MALAADIVAILEPLPNNAHDGASSLQAPFIQIKKNAPPTILGRNTCKDYNGLPQTAATVEWKNNQVWFERFSSHCSVLKKETASVSTEDALALDHGDVVRLYKQEYVFRVKLISATSETSNSTSTNKVLWKQTEEECMCAVCMDILVEATAIVPCGHVYCKECLQDVTITECPNCRLDIQTTLPVKTVDNLIEKLVRSKQIFQQQDVEHYMERTKPPPPPDSPGIRVVPRPAKRARRRKNTPVVSVDLTAPQQQPQQQVGGSTADDAICID